MYHLAWYSIATIDVEVDILIRGVLKEKEGGLRARPGTQVIWKLRLGPPGPGPRTLSLANSVQFLGKKKKWSPSVWLWWGWIPALSKIQ